MAFRLRKGDPVVAYHDGGAGMLGHVSDVSEADQSVGKDAFCVLFKGPGNVTFAFSPVGDEWHNNLGWHLAIPAGMLVGRKID